MTALRHFTDRRGICSRLLADNGTNFMSAARELKKLYKFLKKKEEIIHIRLAKQKIESCLIPKLLQISEDYGTICMKRYFYAVRVKVILTFEKYYTLLVKIEAVVLDQ